MQPFQQFRSQICPESTWTESHLLTLRIDLIILFLNFAILTHPYFPNLDYSVTTSSLSHTHTHTPHTSLSGKYVQSGTFQLSVIWCTDSFSSDVKRKTFGFPGKCLLTCPSLIFHTYLSFSLVFLNSCEKARPGLGPQHGFVVRMN